MTLDPNSPLHFLNGLTPDPDAVKDARAFALMLPAARDMGGRVEDLCMCFAHFATQHTGPRLPGAQAEALHVFTFAASGLFAFLEDGQRPGLEDGWATLSRARLWAVDKCQGATADLPRAAVEALHLAFSSPFTLPAWASQQARRRVCLIHARRPRLPVFSSPAFQAGQPVPSAGHSARPSMYLDPHTGAYISSAPPVGARPSASL